MDTNWGPPVALKPLPPGEPLKPPPDNIREAATPIIIRMDTSPYSSFPRGWRVCFATRTLPLPRWHQPGL